MLRNAGLARYRTTHHWLSMVTVIITIIITRYNHCGSTSPYLERDDPVIRRRRLTALQRDSFKF